MNEQVLFSVIVPVYNVEKYIVRCLRSVVEQTCDDFELIVVDDETPDRSIEIAKEYLDGAAFTRYTIIKQKNKGLGGARNTGVRAARGEYLVFLDSDDFLDVTLLAKVKAILEEKRRDIVLFNSLLVDEDGKYIAFDRMDGGFSGEVAIREQKKALVVQPAAWNKVFRREFFLQTGFEFPEKTLYEDFPVTLPMLALAESVYFCGEALYNYVQRKGSIMHSKLSPRILEMTKVCDLLIAHFTEKGIYEAFREEIEYLISFNCLLIHVATINYRDRENAMQSDLVRYVKNAFPDCAENRYFSPAQKAQVEMLLAGDFGRYYREFTRKRKFKDRVKACIPAAILRARQKRLEKRTGV